MSIMLRCMHAHFSQAQAMRDPVTYEFIVGVDNLNIFTTSSGQLLTT